MSTALLELPCGFESPGAKIERRIEICKLKGTVQREIGRLSKQANPDTSAILDAVLQPSVLSLGGAAPSLDMLQKLGLGDRDWLLYEIRKHTYGPLVTLREECPDCPKDVKKFLIEDFDLNTLPVTRIDDTQTLWWDGQNAVSLEGLTPEQRGKLSFRVFSVANAGLGARAVFYYPRGKEQKAISKMANDEIGALWKLMAMTCVLWEDAPHGQVKMPHGGFKESFWEDLDMDVLTWVQGAYGDQMPGVDTIVHLPCPNGHTNKYVLRAVNFLFPGASGAA